MRWEVVSVIGCISRRMSVKCFRGEFCHVLRCVGVVVHGVAWVVRFVWCCGENYVPLRFRCFWILRILVS